MDGSGMSALAQRTVMVRVSAFERLSRSVVSIKLAPVDTSQPLPSYEPGAHIDVHLPNGLVRQYSLCGDGTPDGWEIAVKAVPGGAGSTIIHARFAVGTTFAASLPRNNFPLKPAANYIFVAGGIGLTPLLPMMARANTTGASFHLHYCVGEEADALFPEARSPYSATTYIKKQGMRFDAAQALRAPQPETLIYCCGPASLMKAVEEATSGWPAGTLHCEWFAPKEEAAAENDRAFELVCARSGLTLQIPADKSILQVLLDTGLDVPRSCEMGICASCEVNVLEGEVDHRDSILSPQERAAGKTMFCCVSRARGDRLVLDV
jgi:tetrachlorobenzoquinone reductase